MKKSTLFSKWVLWVIMCIFTIGSLQAEVRVHNIFDQNMVLQRGGSTKIWGWADVGESVTVTYSGQTKSTKTDGTGNWSVNLEDLRQTGEG